MTTMVTMLEHALIYVISDNGGDVLMSMLKVTGAMAHAHMLMHCMEWPQDDAVHTRSCARAGIQKHGLKMMLPCVRSCARTGVRKHGLKMMLLCALAQARRRAVRIRSACHCTRTPTKAHRDAHREACQHAHPFAETNARVHARRHTCAYECY